jgi:predicted flavoprotein YhiN
MGLVGYTGNELLNTSAQERAEYLKDLGTTTHKRESTDGYYNYRSIKDWFADEGIGFHDEEGTMFSESL